MKTAFVIHCRNKEKFVARAIDAALAQTYAPMDIVLSDQDSTDSTLQIINEKTSSYKGPNNIIVLRCHDTAYKGMAGMNVHLNWIHRQIDADVIIASSADDYSHPTRAEKVVKAFKDHNPDMVGNCTLFLEDDGTVDGERPYKGSSQFVTPEDVMRYTFGGACSLAWRREFYIKHEMQNFESIDMILPIHAAFERGFYYLDETLHTYVKHKDPNNTGIENRIGAAVDPDSRLQLEELQNYHFVSNIFAIIRRLQESKYVISKQFEELTIKSAVDVSHWMCRERAELNMKHLPCLMMGI